MMGSNAEMGAVIIAAAALLTGESSREISPRHFVVGG
jgi:hypothetical protein